MFICKKRKNIIFNIICLCVVTCFVACSKMNNHAERIGIECGIAKANITNNDRIIRFTLGGLPIVPDDLLKVTVGADDRRGSISSRGCLLLKAEDKGDVILLHKDRIHAYLADFSTTYNDSGSAKELEAFDDLNARPEASAKIFENFCRVDTVYLASMNFPIDLNFDSFPRLAGMEVSAVVQHGTDISHVELHSSNLTSSPGKTFYNLTLPNSLNINQLEQYSVKVSIRDLFDNKVASPECSVVVSSLVPELASIEI